MGERYFELKGHIIEYSLDLGKPPTFSVALGVETLRSCETISGAKLNSDIVQSAIREALQVKGARIPRTKFMGGLEEDIVRLLTKNHGVVAFPYEMVRVGQLLVVRQPTDLSKNPYVPLGYFMRFPS